MIQRPRPSRLRRLIGIALAAILAFAVIGFLILPPIVKSQLEQRASAAAGRTVTVEKVRINPFALSLTLENFNVQDKDGRASFLGWRRLYVDFDLLASIGSHWVISEVALDGFHAKVAIDRGGAFNFADLLALANAPGAAKPASPAKPPRPVRLGLVAVTDARVDFADLSRGKPFQTLVGPVTFSLKEFRTSPGNAPYGFEASTESNERVSWKGVISANPLSSAGEFRLENIQLPKYSPYYAGQLRGDLHEGRLSLSGHYELNLSEGHRALKLTQGGVQLRDLKLMEPGATSPVVALQSLDVTEIMADGLTMKASVGTVRLAGGQIDVRREKDGSLNLMALLPPAPTSLPPATIPAVAISKVAPTPMPEVTLGELTVKDFQVNLLDLAASRPAQLGLSELQFTAKNLALTGSAPMPIEAAFNWAPRGAVKVAGTVSLNPIKAGLKINLTGFELLPLSPYLEQFVNARVTGGTLGVALESTVSLPNGQPPVASVTGDISLEKFALVDAAHNEELAGVGAVQVKGLKASTAPKLDLAIEEISVTAPYARVVAGSDHGLNLAGLARTTPFPAAGSSPPAADAAKPPAAPTEVPAISLGRLVLADGDFSFTDRAVEPNVHMAVTQFGGTVSGLTSVELGKGTVDLKAMVDGSGPVAISGRLDPLGAHQAIDLKIDVRNVDLQPLSPYSGQFAGYELARGKLVLDVKFKLEDKKIDASNVVTLNQFTFGAATNNPQATALPVRMGVALMKDIDGKIVIDLPVQGSLDDPNFRIGKVVLRVVVNLLTKAAVSPFSMLGSMFGGGGDELAFQEFAPGQAELQPVEIKKLETMAKALANRPSLNLDLDGNFDRAPDTFALKRQKLADEVRRAIWEQKHAADPNIASPGELVISPEENAAMVKKLFDAKFPPGTVFGTPLPPEPVVVLPPPPPAGLFTRVLNTVTFKTQREQRLTKSENERRAADHQQAVAAALATGRPLEEMHGRLAEAEEISDDDLRSLAQARARQVRDYFVNVGHIAGDRLFLAQSATAAAKQDKGPRVFLNLQ